MWPHAPRALSLQELRLPQKDPKNGASQVSLGPKMGLFWGVPFIWILNPKPYTFKGSEDATRISRKGRKLQRSIWDVWLKIVILAILRIVKVMIILERSKIEKN